MRHRRRTRSFAAALVVLAFSTMSLVALSAPAQAASSEAVQQLAACLAAEGAQGDLLVVLDTSGSLKETDPNGDRVTAASYLIKRLERYVEASGAKLDVALAGFSSGFRVTKKWTALNATSSSSLVRGVEAFRERDDGFETDYWAAASGARQYLTAKSKLPGRHCQAWVWFSDGLFDLDKRDSADERKTYGVTKPYGPDIELTTVANERRLERAGRTDLCRPGGIADQLRVQQITTLAVGLKNKGAADFSLMEGVASGSAVGGTACGDRKASGDFVPADDIGDLLFAFDELSDPDHPPIAQETKLCSGDVCPEGTHQFVLDPSISKVHILAGAKLDDYQIVLTPPIRDQRVTLEPGAAKSTKTFPGFTVASEWPSGAAVEIDITRTSDSGWAGQWQLTFVAPTPGNAKARSHIRLFGDIKPAWLDAGSATFTTGTTSQLRLGLARAGSDEVLDPSTITGQISMDAALKYANGDSLDIVKGLSKADLTRPVPLDLAAAPPGPATIQLTLQLTTAPVAVAGGGTIKGTTLEPQSVGYPVTIQAPPDFPTVPGHVSFGATEEAGDHRAALPVKGKGCVWLENSESLTLPEGVQKATVSSTANSADSCVEGSLPLNLAVEEVGTGLASGQLTVMTRSAEAGVKPVAVTVAYDLEMKKPRNEAVFWPLLIAITLAGVLIPVALLYLVKWRTAKIPGNSLLIGSLSGNVDQQSSFLSASALSERDMRGVTLAGTSRRSVALNSLSEIRTKVGLGLTEPGYAVVAGQPSASSANPSTTRNGSAARLPLAVQDRWVALLDPANPHGGPVEVVFLLAPTSGKLPVLLTDARNRVPEVVAEVRARLGATSARSPSTPAAAEEDWGPSTPASTFGVPSGGAGPTGTSGSGGSTSSRDEW